LPFRDMKGLIEYAKANPGKLNFAGGSGSITQTTSDRMRGLAGVDWAYVPYKEGGLVMPDLLQGRVHLTISGSLLKPSIDTGKLIPLATTGQGRWSLFPTLPTLQESGLNMFAITWYGIVAPPGVPADIVKRLNAAYNAAMKTPNVEKRLNDFGMSPGYPAPEQFAAFVRSEVVSWTPVIKASGIRFD
jgi:tripartite-type tricarboxylate transporter receptor subunit TctC